MAGDKERELVAELHQLKEEILIRERVERFRHENGGSVDFSDLTLEGLTIVSVNFHGWKFQRTIFRNCLIRNSTSFDDATLDEAEFINCKIDQGKFEHTSAKSTKFLGGRIRNSRFLEAFLNEAQFGDANNEESRIDLREVRFERTILDGTKFDNVVMDNTTSFTRITDCKKMTMDAYMLASLNDGSGGLTLANKQDLTIRDDLFTVRSQFGGIWFWAHAIGLLLFVSPYLWFVFHRLTTGWLINMWNSHSQQLPDRFHAVINAEQAPMWKALLRFIVSGGETWDHWQVTWTFGAFLIYLVYNVARMALLWKTKTLETEMEVRGIPPRFSITSARLADNFMFHWVRVSWLYWIIHVGWIFALLALIGHTIAFLLLKVPV